MTLERCVPPNDYKPPGPSGAEEWRTVARFELPSQTGNEVEAMHRVAAAVADLDLSPGQLERLKTAVAEATMNGIEHGNKNRAELMVAVEVVASRAAVAVRISDQGGGKPIPEPQAPDIEAKLAGLQSPRGWGMFLIKKMVDEMRVTTDQEHHTVELVIYRGGEPHAKHA